MNNAVNSDMSEFWNGAGGEKWLRFQESTDLNLRPFSEKTIAAANLLPGEAVLDIGCGCGDTSFEIARLTGETGRVFAIDISAPILRRARALAKSGSGKNVRFECGDAQTYNFNPGTFNLVFSRFGVMFFDDPVAAFTNLHTALKPGGRTAFICWQPLLENEWIKTSLDVVAHYLPLPEPSGPDEPGPMSFGDPARVKHILTASGFSNVNFESCDTAFTIGRNIDEAATFLMQLGPAGAVINQSEADDAVKENIAKEMCEALEPFTTKAGVTLGAATWIVTAQKAD